MLAGFLVQRTRDRMVPMHDLREVFTDRLVGARRSCSTLHSAEGVSYVMYAHAVTWRRGAGGSISAIIAAFNLREIGAVDDALCAAHARIKTRILPHST